MPRTGSSGRSAGVDPEQLWSQAERPRRGRPPAHSRAAITTAAIALADAEGLAAVTMRAVAARIGAGTMSLYSYVPTKETLLELMIDQVSGEHGLAGCAVRQLAGRPAAVRAGAAHDHATPSVAPRGALGPADARPERARRPGVRPRRPRPRRAGGAYRLETFSLLTGFVASHVSYELAQERAVEAGGPASGELLDAQDRYLRSVAAGGRYPHLAQALAVPGHDSAPQAVFDRLLDRMIDGLTAGV